MRIDDSHCRRKLIRRLVVIDHYDIQPEVSRRIDFTGVRNAAINRHDQTDSALSQAL